MAILENRVKTRNHLIELIKVTFFLVKKSFALILICASCFMLYSSSVTPASNVVLEVTGRTLSIGTSIYQETLQKVKWAYDQIARLQNLETENLKLKLEIANLKQQQQNTLIARSENKQLRELLKVTAGIKYNYLTAKIIGMSISPFSNTAIIGAGSADNVKIDDLVLSRYGLIGRITKVSKNYATVMLISDHNSRIPVITGHSREKGIIARQGDDLRIIYLPENHKASQGEAIYTSGDGKIYPRGLKLAVIDKVDDQGVIVKMSADLDNIEFVTVQSK